MSLDFNFSLEELEAAEAATANPYLSNPAKRIKDIKSTFDNGVQWLIKAAEQGHTGAQVKLRIFPMI